MPNWLEIHRGDAPLIVSIPHSGADLLPGMERGLVNPWLARKDTDWHVEKLYDFAPSFGATTIRTAMSRTVIDVNRDPSGKSLYPGQATTELCPTTSFDGEALYRQGHVPNAREITMRRSSYFDPYHAALRAEIARVRSQHAKVVLLEAHTIRSTIRRLFDGTLPDFSIGTNSGESCDSALAGGVETICDSLGFSRITNGRFKGGWITRHYGKPADGVHAIQIEIACRAYMMEPPVIDRENWPASFDPHWAAPVSTALQRIVQFCLNFASSA